MGVNDRGWKADIDWFLKPESVMKIIEGKYTQKTKAQTPVDTGKRSADDIETIPRS
jgi:hypothetical protein